MLEKKLPQSVSILPRVNTFKVLAGTMLASNVDIYILAVTFCA